MLPAGVIGSYRIHLEWFLAVLLTVGECPHISPGCTKINPGQGREERVFTEYPSTHKWEPGSSNALCQSVPGYLQHQLPSLTGLVCSELFTFEDFARNIVLELFTHSRRAVQCPLRQSGRQTSR
jgi:hypothetical protein